MKLISAIQRSSGGTEAPLRWDGCTDYSTGTACINPANTTMANMGITPSTAQWDWNPTTGVLSMTGDFNSASTINSSGAPAATVVIGDKVTDLVINTATSNTTAASYECAEGNFLAIVGANGCLNLSLGGDGVDQSSATYNVGGVASCMQRTIGGDDTSTGNPRGLVTQPGGGGCDPTDGAFDLWTVLQDDTGTGGQLVVSNGIPIADPNTFYLTFDTAPRAVDDTADVIPTVAKVIDVLANDIALTDPVDVAIGTQGSKGTAVVTGTTPGAMADIRIEYTANAGATGTDTFTYTVTSGSTTTTGTVTVTALEGGANPDTAATTRNKPVTINVGANDSGFTDPVTVSAEGTPACDAGGSFTPGAAGPVANASIVYTPSSIAGSASYTEHCTYRITDANSLSDTATVTIAVTNNVPNAPNAGAITSISTAGADPSTKSGTIDVATIPGNNAGDAPITVVPSGAGKGTVSAPATGTVVTYTPNADFFEGTDSFSYTITDGDGETTTGTVTVTIANATPAVADVSITTTEGQASAATALALTAGNGSLAQHTLAVTTQATGGSCALTGTSVTYTPNAGFTGSDSCVITVTDGDGGTDTGTVNVTVDASAASGIKLPGGSSSADLWSLALLVSLPLLRRRRR